MKPEAARDYIEIRCNRDNTLLFRARHVPAGEIEIKCRRCGDKRCIKFPIRAEEANRNHSKEGKSECRN